MSPTLDFKPLPMQKGVFARSMYGIERLTAAMAEYAGYGHIFMWNHVHFKAVNLSPPVLVDLVRAAWIHTRFVLPWVACRTSAEEKDAWFYTYETPSNVDAVTKWATETVFWSDDPRSKAQWEDVLKSKYWKASEGRYSMELHLARASSGGGYFLMVSVGHWMIDGRALLTVMDLFFKNLRLQMQGNAAPLSSLSWGQEIVRLPSANIQAVGQASHRNADPPAQVSSIPINSEVAAPFVCPTFETPQWEGLPSLQASIQLSKDETTALKAACRRHKASVTAALVSIHILADIEIGLRVASSRKNKDASNKVLEHFNTAGLYQFSFNVMDRRGLLPPHKLAPGMSPGAFGNIVCEIMPTIHDMAAIRKCINTATDGVATATVMKGGDFWNGVVADTTRQLKGITNGGSTQEAYAAVEHMMDSIVPSIGPLCSPGVGCSSIGRVSSLGLMDDFVPSRAMADPCTPFIVEDLSFAIRATGADVMGKIVMLWEYDERVNIHLLGSPRWHSPDSWVRFEACVRRLIGNVIQSEESGKCKL
ncbi:hypothetical protein D9613_010774 [Agrocybe pediades]|uniref:Uncharacterized protein n=1 Tax=Agrocybe pediades TaxID=84607 RepID=A0A8H4QLU1_9AGAR|nr:hypothetical protein D9613_010774 [Agrocybe pediades]